MKSTIMKITAILLTAAVLFCTASCSLNGETEEEETTIAGQTALPTKEEDILTYFNTVFAAARDGKAKLTYSSSYEPKDFKSNDQTFASMISLYRKEMNFDALGAESIEVEYGKPHSALMPIKDKAVLEAAAAATEKADETTTAVSYQASTDALALTMDDIVKIEINRDEFAQKAEEESKLAKDSEYETQAVNTDPDVRRIYIELKEETDPAVGSLFSKIFVLPDRDAVAKEMEKASAYLTYSGNYQAKYTGCTIYMEVDRLTDQVIKVEFNRSIEVTMTVTGVGKLASYGTQQLTFRMEGRDSYEFNWEEPQK